MNKPKTALTENWERLTPEQKRGIRYQGLIDAAQKIKFINSDAEKHYYSRLQRLIDVYNLRQPDRVPVSVVPGVIPFQRDGIDYATAIHDPRRALSAVLKFNAQYSAILDTFTFPFMIPANALEIMDYHIYVWPGHGLPASNTGLQFVEGEYMLADEYDALIKNPADFWMRTYLPRVMGAWEPLRNVSALSDMIEFPIQLAHLAKPEIRETLQKMIRAGEEWAKYIEVNQEFGRIARENGFPALSAVNGYTKAPFDIFGDTLRGTLPLMKDMYRCPGKLLKAMDVMADLEIETVLNSPDAAEGVKLFFALHKGADGWMSKKQFDTFYWPPLKKVMQACINEGFLLQLFVEGSFNTRLESFLELPKGSLHLWFDQTDIVQAKRILGDKFCIEGNIPSSLLVTGKPQDVKEHCRKLIEVCGKGGGYILGCGAAIENPKLENLIAMVESAREYGVY
jgi:uroporphyrinogen-III decarboxylase